MSFRCSDCIHCAEVYRLVPFNLAKDEGSYGWCCFVSGGLGLDNKCLLCLLEQCILECLQMRSNAIPYFESLYVKLIEEANFFEHGRQVCFYRHVYVVMKESKCGIRV